MDPFAHLIGDSFLIKISVMCIRLKTMYNGNQWVGQYGLFMGYESPKEEWRLSVE
jgi:hypothetical protein